MKQYVKYLNKESKCFDYICKLFSGLSTKKFKAGVFDDSGIRNLIKDDEFNSMNDLELCAWTLFVDVVKNLFGNQSPGQNLQGVNGKVVEKSTGHRH